ncbi:hypothetical protein Sjap_021839 [Stephania japonica]|uniref:Uncharacterized protein n=1 Tax=Stephania japonica TaxID=461633 RepID=A0AAP0HT66_9MAGN
MLDNQDEKESFVLEISDELPNLKEGIHVSLSKVVNATFVVDISKGEGIVHVLSKHQKDLYRSYTYLNVAQVTNPNRNQVYKSSQNDLNEDFVLTLLLLIIQTHQFLGVPTPSLELFRTSTAYTSVTYIVSNLNKVMKSEITSAPLLLIVMAWTP